MIEQKVSAGQYLVRDPNFSGEGLHFTLNGDNSIEVASSFVIDDYIDGKIYAVEASQYSGYETEKSYYDPSTGVYCFNSVYYYSEGFIETGRETFTPNAE